MLPPVLSNILLSIGTATLLFIAYNLHRFITLHFLPSRSPLAAYKPKDHTTTSWALITGSSAGIGYGLANKLLSLDFGVIILAHEGVSEAVSRLHAAHPNASARIKSFTLNCMTAPLPEIEALVASLEPLPITLLINNVGSVPLPPPVFRHFRAFAAADIDNTINLNLRFATHFTRLMIPHLTRTASSNACRALVLNLSSGARTGMPYLSIYSATKAFNHSFSSALTREFRHFDYPIDCLCIVPGDVRTEGNRLGMQGNAPLAKDFARMVVERVDEAVRQGRVEMSPYWRHAVQIKMLGVLPEGLTRGEMAKVIETKIEAFGKEQ
ncbi:NAD(P)-binding protein [Trematosphaeria pertusa]|uniref:NAD(P)-binding protein n=1 Tax=Trematosphaeria pertusa TaxID=390896 RepID=A0A6A6HWX9_9PLEO|nr:NAD(P)-binding protein [Trematosphaeria pertusa]KAF2242714.1 NAD(P)-binding protein [Trematosphaeria pertusa]